MDHLVPGDKVDFINEKLKGEVSDIIDNKQVMVMLENGLEIPANINELIKLDEESSENEGNRHIKMIEFEDLENGVFIAFSTDKEHKNPEIFFINHTKYDIFYTISKSKPKKNRCLSNGQIKPYSLLEINQIKQFQINILYLAEMIFFSSEQLPYKSPLSYFFRLPAEYKKSNLISIPLISKKGILVQIDKNNSQSIDYIKSLKALKINEKDSTHSGVSYEIINTKDEIDLHIESFREDHNFLEPYEILNYQLEYFKQSLTKAVALNYEKIVFIHGVGQGILKEKITEMLKKYPHVKKFNDADYKRYGNGATEVFLEHEV